ncbi:MAG: serine--tRNA ligase, partial [Gemmatimonadaceae bacterium]
MHDIKIFREQMDLLRDGLARRGKLESLAPVLERAETLERLRRATIQAVEERKAARNAMTQEVARLKRAGEDAGPLVEQSRALGAEIARLDDERAEAEAGLQAILYEIPNLTLPDVPAGGEEANAVLRSWGECRPSDGVRPHWEVGEALGILDLPRGAKIAGSGFVALRGAGARLTRALMAFMLDLHTREHGYEEVWVPFAANRASMTGTGQLPKFEEDMYGLEREDLFMVPTAEVPVTNLYRDEILEPGAVPRGFTAYTPCFRSEAGSHGKDVRGLIRQHQFDKVELVKFTTPDQSYDELEALTANAEEILKRLELPYRTMLLCTGDMGFAAAKTYDIEVWLPSQKTYREISSCSNTEAFQARRANIKFRGAGTGKAEFVHALNGSGLAVGRTWIAILENYQQRDGSVVIPDALRP